MDIFALIYYWGYLLARMVSSFSHSLDIIVGVLPVILAAAFQLHKYDDFMSYNALLTMTASTSLTFIALCFNSSAEFRSIE